MGKKGMGKKLSQIRVDCAAHNKVKDGTITVQALDTAETSSK